MPPKKTAARRRKEETSSSSSEEEETSSSEEEETSSSEEEEQNSSASDPDDGVPLAQRHRQEQQQKQQLRNNAHTAAAAAAGARAVKNTSNSSNNNNTRAAAVPKDILSEVAQIFSDVHLSSTTHSDSKRRFINLFNSTQKVNSAAEATAANNNNNNNNSNKKAAAAAAPAGGGKNRAFEEFLDAVLKATIATCVTLDTAIATRHVRFLRTTFESITPPADRVVPVLYLVNGLYAKHNCAEESSRLHVLSAVLELVRALPENSASPPWFSDLVEVIKLRSRDKSWQVREKAVQLLTAFSRHAPEDDVTQVMMLVASEDTKTEVRRTLLRLLPPKSIYFPVFVRALDDKVALVRKQAWSQMGHYSWVRVEAYGARSNVVALVAMGLGDTAKTVQQECATAVRNWSASRAAIQNGVPPSAVEMLTMLIGVYDPNCDMPPEQQTYISTVADHLFREYESNKSKKKGGTSTTTTRATTTATTGAGASKARKNKKNDKSAADKDDDDDDGAKRENNDNDDEDDYDEDLDENLPLIHRAELVAPLPYPLVLNGITTANISMWAAHCRAAVTAGKTDLEERLLPPLRRFAQILQESIAAFHETFEIENQTDSVGANNKLVRISKAHETEHVIYILLRTFVLYRESGYLAHIDSESTEALARTFNMLLLTTMEPVTTFCAEAIDALYAISHKKNVSECVSSVVQSLFRSLTITRNYGLVMDDSETFGRRDRERRMQVADMERRDNMLDTAQAWQAGLANDNLYMLRMMHVVLEFLSGRSRSEKTPIPAAVDQAIRLGREWGGNHEVKTVAIRALGVMCLANPSIVPTYIGLLVHSATQPEAGRNNPHERNASIAACFDVLCEYGAGFFKRDAPPKPAAAGSGLSPNQTQMMTQEGAGGSMKTEGDDDAARRGGDYDEISGVLDASAAAATAGGGSGGGFDIQMWDAYCTSLLGLCVHPEGQVRRLAVLGAGKMLACNRFLGETSTVAAALVLLSYVAPTLPELNAIQRGVLTRQFNALRLTQEKCQIAHANECLLFFCKSYGASTPRRMRLMLEAGIVALRLLLRRAAVSHAALDAATRFVRRLIAVTDACGLELVRDIDPRFAEAAKARMEAAGASGGDLAAGGGRGSGDAHNSNDNSPALGRGSALLDDNVASQLLSLPPLQDESGNDLHAAARANPALWALLASNSMHETLAEFLLACARSGSGNAVGVAAKKRNSNNNNDGRNAAANAFGGGEENDDDEADDEDDQLSDDEPEELCTAAKQLCARSLGGLHLYKRDGESVNSMCALISQTVSALGGTGPLSSSVSNNNKPVGKRAVAKTSTQSRGSHHNSTISAVSADLAAIISRFGNGYAKSCGRKSFGVASENSSNNNSGGSLGAIESGRSSFAGANPTTVHQQRESAFEKVNDIASPALEVWFRGETLTDSLTGLRRGRNGAGAPSASRTSSSTRNNTQTPMRYGGGGGGDSVDLLMPQSLSSTAARVTRNNTKR